MATNLTQGLFDTVVEFEGRIVYLAASLPMPTFGKRERQDLCARLAVACEGVELLLAEILQVTAPVVGRPEQLPFREDFEELLRVSGTRTRALQELILIGDFSTGQMANVSGVVDVTEVPLKDLVSKLQKLAAAGAVGAAVAKLGGGR